MSNGLTVASLWNKEDKHGQAFLVGNVDGFHDLSVFVFFIPKDKRVDRGPVARLVVSRCERKSPAEKGVDNDLDF